MYYLFKNKGWEPDRYLNQSALGQLLTLAMAVLELERAAG